MQPFQERWSSYQDEEIRVYFVYFDDGGKDDIVIFGGIIVDHKTFNILEHEIAVVINRLIPEDQIDSFTEFHASELYRGLGVFENIDETQRHEAFRQILDCPRRYDCPYVYSAIQRRQLQKSVVSSAHPLDIGFKMCALAVETILRERITQQVKNAGLDLMRVEL